MKITCWHDWGEPREIISKVVSDSGRQLVIVTVVVACVKCGKEIGKSKIIDR